MEKNSTARKLLFLSWIIILFTAVYFYLQADIPLKEYPEKIRELIIKLGIFGPLIFILAYTLRPLIFFPSSILIAASGALFGPLLGIAYSMIGANLSANFAFLLARFFGRKFIKNHEHGKLKKIDELLKENAFTTTLIMRLINLPFDFTNFSCGLSSMRQKDYALATFIGILPALITFVYLGSSFTDPRNLLITGATFLGGILFSLYLKKKHSRLNRLKEFLAEKVEKIEEKIEEKI